MAKLVDQKFEFFQVESMGEGSRFLSLVFEDKTSRNSLSLQAARELLNITDQAASENFKALLFRSAGRVFCSGGNLRDYAKTLDPTVGIKVNREITVLLNRLSSIPLVTLALVEGDCFGGGLELLSAFDEVIATPDVMFGFWQRRIGLSFGWGGGHRLAQRVGAQTLIHLALQARGVFAPQAREYRLIDHVVGASQILLHARDRMTRLTQHSMVPVAPLKDLRRSPSAEVESAMFERLWWNPDHQAALEPFR